MNITVNISIGTSWSAVEQTGLQQHRPNVPRPVFRLLIFPKRRKSQRQLATCHVPAICHVGDVKNSRCLPFQPAHLHMKCQLHEQVATATQRTPWTRTKLLNTRATILSEQRGSPARAAAILRRMQRERPPKDINRLRCFCDKACGIGNGPGARGKTQGSMHARESLLLHWTEMQAWQSMA